MRKCAKICEITNVCAKSWETMMKSCKSVPKIEKLRESVSKAKKMCQNLRNYKKICQNLSTNERVWQKLSKWTKIWESVKVILRTACSCQNYVSEKVKKMFRKKLSLQFFLLLKFFFAAKFTFSSSLSVKKSRLLLRFKSKYSDQVLEWSLGKCFNIVGVLKNLSYFKLQIRLA